MLKQSFSYKLDGKDIFKDVNTILLLLSLGIFKVVSNAVDNCRTDENRSSDYLSCLGDF